MSKLSKISLWESSLQSDDKLYEITVQIRNATGEPTGRTKTYKTDDPFKLWQFWMRNKGKPKRKKDRRIPTKDQAEKILKEIHTQQNND